MPDVAGYRVLRVLARGDRADSLLAFDAGADDDAGDPDGTAGGEPVVIKRFHPTTESAEVARELEALERAAGDHVVALHDVGSETGCACLVFERLAGGDLTGLLRMRGSLDAGEAVTVLAPIAGALARMHAAGVAHGAVAASLILFSADGSPTLIGFGQAELFAPRSPEVVLESVPAVVADREALRALAVSLLERVSISAGDARGLVATLSTARHDQVLELLSTRLFELAAPAPVRFEHDDATGSARALPVTEFLVVPPPERLGLLVRVEPLARLLDQDVVLRLRRHLTDRWRALTTRSRRMLLGGVVVAGVLVVALAASPPAAAPSTGTASGGAASPSSGSTDVGVVEPDPAPQLTEDDPVAAARALLAVREDCLRSASLLCLDGVVQAGSSAEASDRAAVGVIQDGGEPPAPIAAVRLELVERLGDSALVSLGPRRTRKRNRPRSFS